MVLCLSAGHAVASSERMLKSLFYKNTSFGDVAWVKVNTEEAAKDADFVHDLSKVNCAELDNRKTYWFVVNHRKSDRDGITSFLLVSVRARSATGTERGDHLFLYRNANWLEARDSRRPLAAMSWPMGFVADPLGAVRRFVELQDDRVPTNGDEAARESALQSEFKQWHAVPAPEQMSTWAFRTLVLEHSFGGSGQIGVGAEWFEPSVFVQHRLLRFTSTAKTRSDAPVLFAIDRGKMPGDRFEIIVSSPDFGVNANRTVVTTGRPCEAPE